MERIGSLEEAIIYVGECDTLPEQIGTFPGPGCEEAQSTGATGRRRRRGGTGTVGRRNLRTCYV